MYSDLESNESKRREVVSSLYWSLMQGLEYSSFHTGVLRTHGGLPSVPSA